MLLLMLVPAKALTITATFQAIDQGNGVYDLSLFLNPFNPNANFGVWPLPGYCPTCGFEPEGFDPNYTVTINDGAGHSQAFLTYFTFGSEHFDFITTYAPGDYTASFYTDTLSIIGTVWGLPCIGSVCPPGITLRETGGAAGTLDVPVAVPLPAGLPLFMGGLGVLALLTKRRKP
jgi:hypothetical protein